MLIFHRYRWCLISTIFRIFLLVFMEVNCQHGSSLFIRLILGVEWFFKGPLLCLLFVYLGLAWMLIAVLETSFGHVLMVFGSIAICFKEKHVVNILIQYQKIFSYIFGNPKYNHFMHVNHISKGCR